MAVVQSAELEVTILNRAFNDQSPSSTIFYQQKMAAGTTAQSWEAYAFQFGAGYQHLTTGALALQIVGNLGLPHDIGLQGALLSYLDAVGKENVGIVAFQLGYALLGLEKAGGELAVYNAAAEAWSKEVAAAYVYSTNSANGAPSPKGAATGAAGWSAALEHPAVDAAATVQLVGVATPTDAAGALPA